MKLGCAGFLVDYLLFKDGEPVEAIKELRRDLIALEHPMRVPPDDLVGESDYVPEWEPSYATGSRG